MKVRKYGFVIVGFVANIFLFNLAFSASSIAASETKNLNPEYVKMRVMDTDWNIKSKEKAVDRAYINLRTAQSVRPNSVKDAAYYALDNKINVARVGVTIAQNDLNLTKLKAKLSAEQKYYDLIKKQKQYYIDIERVKVAEESYRIAQARYKVGQIARKELIDADVQLSGANLQADVSKNQYEIDAFAFKKLLGFEKGTSIVLDEPMTYTPYTKISNIEWELDDLVEESNEIINLQKSLDALEENVKAGQDVGASGTDAYDDAVTSLEEAQLTYDRTKDNLEVAVYGAYIALQTSEEQIKILNKKLDLAAESLRVEKLKYKSGLSTSLQVSQTNNQYIDVLNQRLEAIYTYNINKAKFENKLFTDMGA